MYNISNVSESVISSVKVSNDFMEKHDLIDPSVNEIDRIKLFNLSMNALPSYDTLNIDELLYIWEQSENGMAVFDLVRYCRLNNPSTHDMIVKQTNEIRNKMSNDDVFKQVFPNFWAL